MTLRQTYHPFEGNTSYTDATLAYSKLLMLSREGVVYDIITSNNDILVTNRQVLYQPSTGLLQFDTNIPFNQGETINVVYDPNI